MFSLNMKHELVFVVVYGEMHLPCNIFSTNPSQVLVNLFKHTVKKDKANKYKAYQTIFKYKKKNFGESVT